MIMRRSLVRPGPGPVGVLCAALWLAGAGPALAHPHVWIDTTTTFTFDGERRLVAIEARWVFDDMYSALEVEDRDANHDGRVSPEELGALAEENIRRLKSWGYFSVLKVDGERVPLGTATAAGMTYDGKLLTFTMKLPLVQPVDPRRSIVRFSMFDPTFFIEIVPAKENPVFMRGAAPDGCAASIQRLDEQGFIPDQLAATSRVDPSDPEASVGAEFAEWIEFHCGSPS